MKPSKMPQNYKDIFFHRKMTDIFLSIRGGITATKISEKTGILRSYISRLLDNFEGQNLIKKLRLGREVRIYLTEEGKDLKSVLEAVYER